MGLDRELMEQIIDQIFEGETIQNILKKRKLTRSSFFKTLDQYPDLDGAYGRACASRGDGYFDEIVDISDNDPDPQRARNRIDARKWVASKMRPEKYGDRIDLNISQFVDIRTPLEEALRRTSLPMRDQQNIIDVKTLQITEAKSVPSTDSISEAPGKTGNAEGLTLEDLLA